MTYETLDYAMDDGIVTLTLNRPDQLNAFTVTMANELVAAFGRASEDDAVRAVIVTGAGRAFCAGMDLSLTGNVFGLDERLTPSLDDMERLEDPQILNGVRDTGGRVSLAIYDCKKPVIAAINGAAVGVGATMTLAMDFRLASDKARIGFVFGRIGVTPEACSSWFLPRIVGLQQALEWVYTADIFGAEEALRSGLVRSVHAPDDLLAEARALAHRLVDGRSPVAVALARQLMLRNSALPDPLSAHKIELRWRCSTPASATGKEGVASFREKRSPQFEGRASQMPRFYPWW